MSLASSLCHLALHSLTLATFLGGFRLALLGEPILTLLLEPHSTLLFSEPLG
jgi:hypothetical protein